MCHRCSADVKKSRRKNSRRFRRRLTAAFALLRKLRGRPPGSRAPCGLRKNPRKSHCGLQFSGGLPAPHRSAGVPWRRQEQRRYQREREDRFHRCGLPRWCRASGQRLQQSRMALLSGKARHRQDQPSFSYDVLANARRVKTVGGQQHMPGLPG